MNEGQEPRDPGPSSGSDTEDPLSLSQIDTKRAGQEEQEEQEEEEEQEEGKNKGKSKETEVSADLTSANSGEPHQQQQPQQSILFLEITDSGLPELAENERVWVDEPKVEAYVEGMPLTAPVPGILVITSERIFWIQERMRGKKALAVWLTAVAAIERPKTALYLFIGSSSSNIVLRLKMPGT